MTSVQPDTVRPAPADAAGPWGELEGRRFTKGHGTGNDFVLLSDPHAELALDAELVGLVCDRHRGIGGDGLIRAVRSEALPEGRSVLADAPDAEWFMDYRNNDGSIAEMCGNGVRVFVHYLLQEGLADVPEGEMLRIGTRAGVRTVARTGSGYAVDMGPWSFLDGASARSRGSDAEVTARGLRVTRPALSIGMGNPHTVVALAEGEKLDQLDLTTAPEVRPVPEDGTNVEFVVPADGDDDGMGRVRMRVHERGVGETQSCGTGACAAAAAPRFWGGATAPDQWLVQVPGGVVSVTFVPAPDGSEHVVLAGPAVLVAEGTFV